MPRILIATLDQTRPLAESLLAKLAQYYQSIGLLSDDNQVATQSIAVADLLLVVMGAGWTKHITDNQSQFDAVADALRRSDLPIITVLADGATMPPVADFAPEHRAIAYMSQASITQNDSFDADALTLARQMAGYIQETSPEGYAAQTGKRATSPKKRSGIPVNVLIIVMALLFGVLIVAIPRLRNTSGGANPTPTPRFNETVSARMAGRDFQLGVSAGLSNSTDARGQEMLNGVELALSQRPSVVVNDLAHNIDILVQDNNCTAGGGIAVANNFIASPDIVAVIGAGCEEACKSAVGLYDRAGISTISPACTSPILTQDNHPSFYRVIASGDYNAIGSAQFAIANGWMNAVIISDEQLVGIQLANAFEATYLSGNGASTRINIETTTFSMTTLVNQITEANPMVVYFAGRESTLVELRANLPETMPLIGGLLINENQFVGNFGAQADNIYLAVSNLPDNPQIAQLRQQYVAQFGTQPTSLIFAYAYDATNMLLDAVEQIATDENGLILVDRFALREALKTYMGDGVTGKIACDGDGDCAELSYTVYTIQNGELVVVGE